MKPKRPKPNKPGKVSKVVNCCREVRLGLRSYEPIGSILSGWNSETDQFEEWEVISTSKHTERIFARLVGTHA